MYPILLHCELFIVYFVDFVLELRCFIQTHCLSVVLVCELMAGIWVLMWVIVEKWLVSGTSISYQLLCSNGLCHRFLYARNISA